ncbi:hypothetical protein BGX26_004649, partial [Mortierella sp. AD094]
MGLIVVTRLITMEETQSFRLNGTTDTIEITIDHVGGQNIVYWEDIEQVFPGVKHVQNGKVAINMLRSSDGTRIKPHCIKHCPDVVLDVVLSTTLEHIHADSRIATISPAPAEPLTEAPTKPYHPGAIIDLLNPPSSSSTKGSETNSNMTSAESVHGLAIVTKPFTELGSSEPLHFGLVKKSTMQIQKDMKVATDAMIARNRAGKPLDAHSIVEENLHAEYHKSVATLMTAKPGFERTVIKKLDGIHDQGHTTQEIVRQVLKETQEIKDRLILIQSKTEAILTQQLELAEYPIPRLFIVLPEEPT